MLCYIPHFPQGSFQFRRAKVSDTPQSRYAIYAPGFNTTSNQLIEKLGWKTINELIDIESKTMVFKSLNELAPPYLRSLFRKNLQSTSYRSIDLRVPKKGTDNGKKCFSFRGAKLRNSLSANCKQAAFLRTFKQHI